MFHKVTFPSFGEIIVKAILKIKKYRSTGKPCISALLVLKNEKSCASLNLRSSSRFYNYALFGVSALIIEAAAFFPAPNARMTVAAPLTASPPA